MRELLMGISDLVIIASIWSVLKAVPGLAQVLGFLYGALFAFWAFDEDFWRT